MTTIKVCGVPEHFNFAWQKCLQSGDFLKKNIDLQWTNVPEGTGKMCQMLRDRATDVAVILTEGIIRDICNGNDSKIIQVFVQSPLVWGIHVAAKSNLYKISDLENKKIAISRVGSGSHLMAIVHAKKQKWQTNDNDFEIINNIDGAVVALTENRADYFMWEKLMAKPLVDSGIFRRIGEFPTPWPSFVIAVRTNFLEKNKLVIKDMLMVLNHFTSDIKNIKTIDVEIASFFKLQLTDVKSWLKTTDWSQNQILENDFHKVQNQLLDLQLIDKSITFAKAVATV
jgi:ABC-type nitrate/sulfonate/bicarbonate transport system substrate-binding protein